MVELLLERPWSLITLVCGAAVIGAVVALRPGRLRAAWAIAGIGALVIAGLWILAWAVTSTPELLRRRTVQLVDAVARADVGAVDAMLAPGCEVRSPSAGVASVLTLARGIDRAMILDRVGDELAGEFRVQSHLTGRVDAVVDGPRVARTQVRVRVRFERATVFQPSCWRLHWERGEDGVWRAGLIEPLAIAGAPRG